MHLMHSFMSLFSLQTKLDLLISIPRQSKLYGNRWTSMDNLDKHLKVFLLSIHFHCASDIPYLISLKCI